MKGPIFLLLLVLCSGLSVSAQINSFKPVEEVLMQQQSAWNAGDIVGFMQGYWHNDSLKFVSKNGITQGWQTTLEHYQKSYPDKKAMVQLEFTILSAQRTGRKTAVVLGKWKLVREKDEPAGYFTLFFKKIHHKWLIVMDHTS